MFYGIQTQRPIQSKLQISKSNKKKTFVYIVWTYNSYNLNILKYTI